jgi:hypothetical protein
MFDRVCLVLDAFGECEHHNSAIILEELCCIPNVNILVTPRFSETHANLERFPIAVIYPSDADLRLYITGRIGTDPLFVRHVKKD